MTDRWVDKPGYQGPCRRSEEPIDEMREELSRLTEAINDGARRLKELVEKHEEALYGNGRIGLITRLDRLEQSNERGSRAYWAVTIALVGVVVKSMWDLFTK